MLVLEEHERARARGARIYAEVVGYGTTQRRAPHDGAAPRRHRRPRARCASRSRDAARRRRARSTYVNAHGSSTPLNDPTETPAIRQVFGDHADAAAGEQHEGVLRPRARRVRRVRGWPSPRSRSSSDWLPPTLNLESPDDGCDLDYIPKRGRDAGVEYALSNSLRLRRDQRGAGAAQAV